MSPFVSKAQMKKCFALKSPEWNCEQWLKETDVKKLPKKKKKKRVKKKEEPKKKKNKNPNGEYIINLWK